MRFVLSRRQIHRLRIEASQRRLSATEESPAPPLKLAARVEGAPDLSRLELASNSEETTAGSHAARSIRVSQRRSLPRERATSSAPLSGEEPGGTSWVASVRMGFGSEPPPRGAFRGSAQPLPARIPSQRLPLLQRLAVKFRPWLRVARGWPGNARSPRYVL